MCYFLPILQFRTHVLVSISERLFYCRVFAVVHCLSGFCWNYIVMSQNCSRHHKMTPSTLLTQTIPTFYTIPTSQKRSTPLSPVVRIYYLQSIPTFCNMTMTPQQQPLSELLQTIPTFER